MTAPLRREDLADDPIEQFSAWFAEAEPANPMPTAMTLATADADGRPDARMVLLKGHGPEGFEFFGNYESGKAGQLEANPHAALVLHWLEPLPRQVRVRGSVERVEPAESDAYFASRPRDSQLGAWASPQSRPVADREELDRRLAEAAERFEGRNVERPPHWGGWRLRPNQVEFWQGRQGRLHDRFRYTRDDRSGWRIERLGP